MNMLRRLQLVAHGEPSHVVELNTVPQPALGQDEVLISMEAAPLNPSDFLFIRGIYGVRPAFPSPVGAEGIGRVTKTGSKVDVALQGKRVLILPTYEQGTWADQVVAPVRNIVPVSDEADLLQLAMIGINPVTAYLLLNRYVSLTPGDWIGQTAANSAMGHYIIALAKLAGVKTLNVVRRKEAAEQVRQWGGDRVVLQGDNLHQDRFSSIRNPVGQRPAAAFNRPAIASAARPPGTAVHRGLNGRTDHIAERHDANWHRDWDRRHAHFDHDRFFVFDNGFWFGLDAGFFPWDYLPYYAGDYYPYDYYTDVQPDYNTAPASAYPYGYYTGVQPDYNTTDANDAPVADPTVEAIQERLAQLGYYNGPVDGIFGPATRDAVAKYQIDNQLDVTGSLSPDTLQSLGVPPAPNN